jgi:hypothetical protein
MNIKIRFRLLVILFFAVLTYCMNAQTMLVCKYVNEVGEVIDLYSYNDIPLNIPVTIFIRRNSNTSPNTSFFFSIERIDGSNRVNGLDKVISFSEKEWTEIKYSFLRSGAYELVLKDRSKRIVKTIPLMIKASNREISADEHAASKYQSATAIFAKRIFNEKPQRVTNSVSLSEDEGNVYVYLVTGDPLNTDRLLIKVWKKSNYSAHYDTLVESKKFSVSPDWESTYFKLGFKEAGSYKIFVYDKEELLIKTLFCQVRN